MVAPAVATASLLPPGSLRSADPHQGQPTLVKPHGLGPMLLRQPLHAHRDGTTTEPLTEL